MDVEKIYQMFILGTGNLDYALNQGLGGVIFFTKDILSVPQFTSLITNLSKKSKIPPFFSIDQEGGRVERTEHLHERYLSAKCAYGLGINFLEHQTENIAEELSTYGINMNFAPCLDVNTNPDNPIIGDRAFSSNPYEVCIGYDVTSSVYSAYNIISVVKHFPGHGDTRTDSHKELPHIELSLDEMEKTHILPFKHAITRGVEAIMAGHLHCSCFDEEEIPSSLSKNCLDYLRKELNFNGLIISDDMIMRGVKRYGKLEGCLMGIKAGVNIFIYRNSGEDTLNLIEDIIRQSEGDIELRERIEYSYNKIMELKRRHGII